MIIKTNFICNTAGNGLWSREERKTKIYKLTITIWPFNGKMYGELLAFFHKRDWDTDKHGLIYTDRQWMRDFKENLLKKGFTDKALKDLDYSEQGMQRDNAVSMDIGTNFCQEAWEMFNGHAINLG